MFAKNSYQWTWRFGRSHGPSDILHNLFHFAITGRFQRIFAVKRWDFEGWINLDLIWTELEVYTCLVPYTEEKYVCLVKSLILEEPAKMQPVQPSWAAAVENNKKKSSPAGEKKSARFFSKLLLEVAKEAHTSIKDQAVTLLHVCCHLLWISMSNWQHRLFLERISLHGTWRKNSSPTKPALSRIVSLSRVTSVHLEGTQIERGLNFTHPVKSPLPCLRTEESRNNNKTNFEENSPKTVVTKQLDFLFFPPSIYYLVSRSTGMLVSEWTA